MCSCKSLLCAERGPAALVLEVAMGIVAWPDGAWGGLKWGPADRVRTAATRAAPTSFPNVCVMDVLLLVSCLTWISPRIDRCRSQKYGYTPRWVSSTVAVAPLPTSGWLNLPSRLSGVPDVMVWVMSSWLVKVTLLPAATSMGVGLNWKVWTVTPGGDCAAALPAPSASATAA